MPSSSGNRPAEPSVPPGSPGMFIDWGPSLPESYGRPRVVALVRDPNCFFATWEEGDAIRAKDLTAGGAQEQRVGRVGSWYFEGLPEHEYEIELLAGGTVVAVSARIRLPRLDPASAVDPAWVPTPGQEELLRGLRSELAPLIVEIEGRGESAAWRRRVAGMPVSRPSRTS